MNGLKLLVFSFLVIATATSTLLAQSGAVYRRSGIMNGNQVRTVFGNWGVIGQPAEQGHRGAWKNNNNGYIGDVTPLIGAEIHHNGVKFHSVATCPTARPSKKPDTDPNGKYMTLEPVAGYFNANQSKVAMSSDPKSWPPYWPDIKNPSNPLYSADGWGGAWNGYDGKKVSADLETYFVMDDNNDERFSVATNNASGIVFKPDTDNPQRNGMALEVKVRAMQWNDPLAKDNIFWLYDVSNAGTTTYNQVVLGFLVGTYVGVTSTEDYKEYNDDWSFYDVFTNLTYTGDYKPGGGKSRNPLWVGRVGMVGYAFLESPGNPYDGIDNDADADSSSMGRTAPLFTQQMFTDSVEITVGKTVIVINNDFSRSQYTIPDVDSIIIPTRGNSTWVYPRLGTKVIEGNLVSRNDTSYINPNAYDGVDNNYNGLIDENQYLHYEAVKQTRTNPPVVLLKVPHVVHYVNYGTGNGSNPLSMIDERRDDGIDNNGDWNFVNDDVGSDGILNSGDNGEGDGVPTIGEPRFDKTDPRESDQIGLTSFFYFAPASEVNLRDDEELWKSLAPGFFDVPTSIVNNKPVGGEDGDFIYGSGYFPLLAKKTERFSLALVFGGGYGGKWPDDDIADLLKNKKVVQQIYDANYHFPIAPDKPTVKAVAGDKQVTLYWDRRAEESIDPVLQVNDFEGYKIYKSTDPNFSDIYTVTDAHGIPIQYQPLAQFDVKNGIRGLFRAPSELYQQATGMTFDLGEDTGLQHTFVDNDVQNGRRYYYAVVAYDRGDEVIGLYPKENTKFVTILSDGTIDHDINVAVVTPNAKTTGYIEPQDTATQLKKIAGMSTGSISYQIVDPTKLTGHTYQVTFFDTQNDFTDNNGNSLFDVADSTEWTRITTLYNVKDVTTLSESFTANDTSLVRLQRKNLDASTIVVKNADGNIIPMSKLRVDALRGTIRGEAAGDLPAGKYTIEYQYYPVWRSPHIHNSPYASETKDADIFDGIQLIFNNHWSTTLNRDTTATRWVNTPYQYSFNFHSQPLLGLVLYSKPSDYEIQIYDRYVDTAVAHPDWSGILDTMSTKFRIYNLTDSTYIKFYLYDTTIARSGDLKPGQQIIFIEKAPNGKEAMTWTMYLPDTAYPTIPGSKLVIKTVKPFNSTDLYELTTELPKSDIQIARQNPLRVRVVPNPYVTASEFEPPLNPGITSGRGTRKIDFIHLPAGASIKIFTARGDHVVTLNHDGNIENGAVSWNLKTKENLDVAFGVYFYVVESPAGNQTGKIAIIK